MTETIDAGTLSESIREVLANECTIEIVRRHVDGDPSVAKDLWRTMVDLGWPAICAPETSGGLALGPEALAMLCREAGRALAPVPLLPAMLALQALDAGGVSGPAVAWIDAVIAGERTAALAELVGEPGVKLLPMANGWGLRGQAVFHDGVTADLLLVPVRHPEGGQQLAAVEANAVGVTVERRPTVDATRASGKVHFADVTIKSDQLLPCTDEVRRALLRTAALGVAADALGGGESILERTVEYLKLRTQFGRPIGSFQALKHRVADHRAALLGAEALLVSAAARDANVADALEAKALATHTSLAVARDAIQLHGGIGFTWEYPAHLFLKRALLNSMQFGTLEETLDLLVTELEA